MAVRNVAGPRHRVSDVQPRNDRLPGTINPANSLNLARVQGQHAGRYSEQVVHRTVCQHLYQRGVASLVWFHPPNGGRRPPIEAAIFAGLGVRPGVADLILLHDGRAFALELKTEAGRPTVAQMQFVSDFNAAGGTAAITYGLDQAIRTLEIWCLLRGSANLGNMTASSRISDKTSGAFLPQNSKQRELKNERTHKSNRNHPQH